MMSSTFVHVALSWIYYSDDVHLLPILSVNIAVGRSRGIFLTSLRKHMGTFQDFRNISYERVQKVRILWGALSCWKPALDKNCWDVIVQHLIIIDFSYYFIINEIGTSHTTGLQSAPDVYCYFSAAHVFEKLLGFMCPKYRNFECSQIMRHDGHLQQEKWSIFWGTSLRAQKGSIPMLELSTNKIGASFYWFCFRKFPYR